VGIVCRRIHGRVHHGRYGGGNVVCDDIDGEEGILGGKVMLSVTNYQLWGRSSGVWSLQTFYTKREDAVMSGEALIKDGIIQDYMVTEVKTVAHKGWKGW
jgi:hypothetical protein